MQLGKYSFENTIRTNTIREIQIRNYNTGNIIQETQIVKHKSGNTNTNWSTQVGNTHRQIHIGKHTSVNTIRKIQSGGSTHRKIQVGTIQFGKYK